MTKPTKGQQGKLARYRVLLERVADHFLEGPSILRAPASSAAHRQWHSCAETLERSDEFSKVVEVRQLYRLPKHWRRSSGAVELLPMIRQVHWNREADRQRADDSLLRELDTITEYFEVPGEMLAALSDLSFALQLALRALPVDREPMSFAMQSEQEAMAEVEREDAELHADLPVSRFALRLGGRFMGLRIEWISGASQEIDEAFFDLWDLVGDICVAANEVEDGLWKEEWTVSPRDYLNMYNSVLAGG